MEDASERYRVAPVKDDRFDAFVLADTLRHEHGHWRALSIPSPPLAELRAFTRDRDQLLGDGVSAAAAMRGPCGYYLRPTTLITEEEDREGREASASHSFLRPFRRPMEG